MSVYQKNPTNNGSYLQYTDFEKRTAPDEYTTHFTKDKARLNLEELNRYQMSKAYDRMYKDSMTEEEDNVKWKEKQQYFQMSIQDLMSHFLRTMNDILLEISHLMTKYQEQLPVSYQDWIIIFIKDDRIFYVGMFFLIISFVMFFINISDD
jgi:hypothetical protein